MSIQNGELLVSHHKPFNGMAGCTPIVGWGEENIEAQGVGQLREWPRINGGEMGPVVSCMNCGADVCWTHWVLGLES